MEQNEKLETEFFEYFKQLNSKDRFKIAFYLEGIAFELYNPNDYKEEIKQEESIVENTTNDLNQFIG